MSKPANYYWDVHSCAWVKAEPARSEAAVAAREVEIPMQETPVAADEGLDVRSG